VNERATTRLLVIAETLESPVFNGERAYSHLLGCALADHPGVLVYAASRHRDALICECCDGSVTASRTMWTQSIRRLAADVQPRAVLYVPEASMTLAALARARVLRAAFKAPVAVLGLQPRTYEPFARVLARVLRPAVLLVPSDGMAQIVRMELGAPVNAIGSALPAIGRYAPASLAAKSRARRKLELPDDAIVYLHVGHVVASRNLERLSELVDDGNAIVVVVGSPDVVDRGVRQMLETSGVRVNTGFVEDLQDYYHAADVYVFPVESTQGCIDVPMSVLEALACGLPVAATAFGALPELLIGVAGVTLVDAADGLADAARTLAADYWGTAGVAGREGVGSTWDVVAGRVLGILELSG